MLWCLRLHRSQLVSVPHHSPKPAFRNALPLHRTSDLLFRPEGLGLALAPTIASDHPTPRAIALHASEILGAQEVAMRGYSYENGHEHNENVVQDLVHLLKTESLEWLARTLQQLEVQRWKSTEKVDCGSRSLLDGLDADAASGGGGGEGGGREGEGGRSRPTRWARRPAARRKGSRVCSRDWERP